MQPINLIAVAVAALAGHLLGALWYSPVLFGKVWLRLSGLTPQQIEEAKAQGMAKRYFSAFVGNLITACVLFYGVKAGAHNAFSGAVIGAVCWLGFVTPVLMGAVLWEGKPMKLYVIHTGYYAISLMIMGAILAAWR